MSAAIGSDRDPLTVLTAGTAAVARAADLDAALEALLALARDSSAASAATVLLQDPDRPGLQLAAAAGLSAEAVAELGIAAASTDHPAAAVAAEGRAAADPRSLTLPLVVSAGGVEQTLGVVRFDWSDERPGDDAVRVLTAVADLVAVAVDRARLAATAAERSEWFERMAHTDPLTGLANERTVARILELELARAGRQGSEVSIALFDVDDFQATNRDEGHRAGDDVLRRVAVALSESVRLVDTVGRIGGDEFILVAPGSAGMTVARRVLDAVGSLPSGSGRPVTVSAGVARFPDDAADADGLLTAAGDALAQARAEGRGQVAASPAGASDPA